MKVSFCKSSANGSAEEDEPSEALVSQATAAYVGSKIQIGRQEQRKGMNCAVCVNVIFNPLGLKLP